MKESYEYYDEETGFFIFIPGDDFREFWKQLGEENSDEEGGYRYD